MSVSLRREMLRDRQPFRPWLTTEDRVLRSLYESAGPVAAAGALPGRSISAVYSRARVLGLNAPRPQRSGRPRNGWHFNDAIDAEIRRVYQGGTCRGELNALCAGLMMPRHVVSRRARLLGLVAPRFKELDWSEREIALLDAHSWKSPEIIQKHLRRAGFHRTVTAIVVKRKRLHMSLDEPGAYSANALAGLMGVDAKTITRWILAEGLRATRRGTARTSAQGGDEHKILEADLRRWIRDHPQLVDLRKVDRFWFIELALGAPQGKEIA